jgi:hypothetical protein
MGVRALVYARRHASRLNIPGSPNREYSTGMNSGWREEHIIAMLISGIAVHTALLVFGTSRTLGLQLAGVSVYVPWLLPAIVGLLLLLWRVRRARALPSTTPSPAHRSQRR